jgi:Uma2 family endonuclease
MSVDEYRRMDFSPDREYIDGAIQERHAGEKSHSKIQRRLIQLLTPSGLEIWPVQRVQVKPTRFRVPDLCVTLSEPDEEVFTSPPFLCVEILSPEDRMSEMQERIEDYLEFGVAQVWVIDPRRRTVSVCDRTGIHRVEGAARTADGRIEVSLEELFR